MNYANPSYVKAPKPTNQSRPELLLPIGEVEYTDTAQAMFPVLAKRERYFVWGQLIAELVQSKLLKDKQYHNALQPLDPDALRSRIEKDFRCMAWRTENGKPVKKPARCPHDTALVLLKTDEAFELLPPVRTLSACPALAGDVGKLRILRQGYHDINNGIYVMGGQVDLPASLDEARKLILGLYRDYAFVSESDKSRAVACFISPALRAGQLLGEADFPLDLSEANVSQSGKTLRLRLVHEAYGETPYLIAHREGGVGSIDESISSALVAAKPFIMIDNYRGGMNSQILETCLRGAGVVGARIPHRGERQVPTGHINWQLSSNGMSSLPDFANRTLISRIRKRELSYQFHVYSEGSILAHLKANQPKYLGAIFRIVMEWDRQGRPSSSENRHDFVEWCRSLDWIVQELFKLSPLLDGHTEELLRISSPALAWLRRVAIAVDKQARLDEGLLPNEIVDICNAAGIEFSRSDRVLTLEQQNMVAGRMLGNVFSDGKQEIGIDRYLVRRDTKVEYNYSLRKNLPKHYHWFKVRP